MQYNWPKIHITWNPPILVGSGNSAVGSGLLSFFFSNFFFFYYFEMYLNLLFFKFYINENLFLWIQMFHFTACNNIKKSKLIISKFNINHTPCYFQMWLFYSIHVYFLLKQSLNLKWDLNLESRSNGGILVIETSILASHFFLWEFWLVIISSILILRTQTHHFQPCNNLYVSIVF